MRPHRSTRWTLQHQRGESLRPSVSLVVDHEVLVVDVCQSQENRQTLAVAGVFTRAIGASIPILHDLEQSKQIKIVGAMQDLATGEATFVQYP